MYLAAAAVDAIVGEQCAWPGAALADAAVRVGLICPGARPRSVGRRQRGIYFSVEASRLAGVGRAGAAGALAGADVGGWRSGGLRAVEPTVGQARHLAGLRV